MDEEKGLLPAVWAKKKRQSEMVSKILEWGGIYEYYRDSRCFSFADAEQACGEDPGLAGWLGEQSQYMNDCAGDLKVTENEDGKQTLLGAAFCKDRLCPVCNWRRSVKLAGQLSKMLKEIEKRKLKGRPITMIISAAEIPAKNLREAFQAMADDFDRFLGYKEVKMACRGAVRTSEVLYNSLHDDYSIRFRCLLWMNPSYFNGRTYLTHRRWGELWTTSATLEKTQIIQIRTLKPEKRTEEDPTGHIRAALKFTRYVAKPTTIPGLDGLPQKASGRTKHAMGKPVAALERSLWGIHLIAYSGIFKLLQTELYLDDPEDGDLVTADGGDLLT